MEQLILAIEPDRLQADRISAMVRTHLSAELVIAGSTANALKALGERVPDLILTPALLPPADDAMLAERLRELGSAAAHIQAVTIPILSDGNTSGERERGMLSALRRDRSREPEPVGCEPAVFSKQVVSYLKRASQERQANAARVPEPAPANQPLTETSQAADASDLTDWLDIDQVMAAIVDPEPAPEPRPAAAPQPQALASPPSRAARMEPIHVVDPIVIEESIEIDDVLEMVAAADGEWESFDPKEAGFPALLARLNTIASADTAPIG